MIEILHVCPANCATGGTEAIHEFVKELNELEGVHARVWYWAIKSEDPCPDELKMYGCEYVTELPEGYDGSIIFPEIWANKALDYPDNVTAVYWLGVDAYSGWTPESERGAFLKDEKIIHIAQSEYAYDFLGRLGVKLLLKCVDIVNKEFYEPYEEHERSDIVLYNPAKATPFFHEIMRHADGIVFKPIQSMTRKQVIENMRSSKLYIDFGEFPGRERIPREAALCGCCLITSKLGSAAYLLDFGHDYKFDSKPGHIWAIIHKIHEVLDNFEQCRKDFAFFRDYLEADRRRLKAQVREVAYEIQRHYPGL